MSVAEALAELGLNSGASDDEVKAAYRQAVLTRHPDRGGDLEAMKRANEARDVLEDRGTSTTSGPSPEQGAAYRRWSSAPQEERVVEPWGDHGAVGQFLRDALLAGHLLFGVHEVVHYPPLDQPSIKYQFARDVRRASRPWGTRVRRKTIKAPAGDTELAGAIEAVLGAMEAEMDRSQPSDGSFWRVYAAGTTKYESWIIFFRYHPHWRSGAPSLQFLSFSLRPRESTKPKRPAGQVRHTASSVARALRAGGLAWVRGGSRYDHYGLPTGGTLTVRIAAKTLRVFRGDSPYMNEVYFGSVTDEFLNELIELVKRVR
jgi:hypothetical protein